MNPHTQTHPLLGNWPWLPCQGTSARTPHPALTSSTQSSPPLHSETLFKASLSHGSQRFVPDCSLPVILTSQECTQSLLLLRSCYFLSSWSSGQWTEPLSPKSSACDSLDPWDLRKLHCLPAVAVHKPCWNAQQTNSRTQIQMPEYANSTSTLDAPLRHPSLPVSSCAPQLLWRNMPWLATWSTKTLTLKI